MKSASAVILVAATLLAAATGCSGTSSPGATAGHGRATGTATAVAGAPATSSPSSAGTPGLLGATASSALGDSLTWWSDHQTTVTAVSNDLGAMATDASSSKNLVSDCTKLGPDEQAAEQLPAMPDAQAQAHWATALKDVRRGLQACHGDLAGNPQQEEAVLSDMGSALTELGSALQRISTAT